MTFLSHCRAVPLALLLLTACTTTPTDAGLVSQDKQLLSDFESLQRKINDRQISKTQFKSGLETLQGREERILNEARHHKFTDPQAGNYFHRMRLKFPSPIAETLKDIQ